jgi:hypothetical protein
VRLEEVTFIVYPEYRFWGVQDRYGHRSECSRRGVSVPRFGE